jgi:PHD/YefM family antitoxin component YafN of YafNO toxin-antitoxin module
METIFYSNARQALRTVIDDCVNNNEPVIIKSKSNDVVLISKKGYDKLNKAANNGK